eukprot:CAMPEP_0174849170 /NCGR_PEP_ID=MMETSP1114-20130205/13934_1 /TAXON_ID=312471 /ORGANISM="Neobodo designis, Strain CCAP 1951/1" /LENGTH=615 /DNA_ID=CAMNT_0016083483 /DNA_START=35 /DNA_END=1882 /DNA_ORIENTATION=+
MSFSSQNSMDSHSAPTSRRQSSIARAASSLRASAASAVSAVEEQIEVGTIGGTALNTTCNVIGAGVLALPLAAHNAGLGWAIILVIVMALVGAFAAYVIFVGCDRSGAFFLNEVFAIAVVGRPVAADERPIAIPTLKGSMAPESPLISQQPRGSTVAQTTPLTPAERASGFDNRCPEAQCPQGATAVPVAKEEPAADARKPPEPAPKTVSHQSVPEGEKRRQQMRLTLSLLIDIVVFCNNYAMLAVYSRVIIDSIPPVLVQFLRVPHSSIWASEEFWCIAPGVIFFGLTSVRNMAELKWSSILGIATIMFAALAIVIEFGRFGYQGDYTPNDTRRVNTWAIHGTFPATLATLTVAYSYHFNAPIFYHELEDRSPRKMMQTVAISFPTIGTTYLVVAVFGYLSFGDHVADGSAGGDVINNYLNTNTLINAVRLGLFFHFACVYPVMSVCVRHSFHRFALTAIGRREEATHPDMPARVPRAVIVAEAFLIVATACAFAYFYGNIGQLIVFVGAICGATIMLTVPGIIGVCIWAPVRDKYGRAIVHGTSTDEPANRPLMKAAGSEGDVYGTFETSDEDRCCGPPPFYHRRILMTALCGFMAIFGLFCTVAAFVSAVFG